MYEWNELDREAEAEGSATKRAFNQPRPKRGVGRANRSALSRDYRAKRKNSNLLVELNVIDGRPTV